MSRLPDKDVITGEGIGVDWRELGGQKKIEGLVYIYREGHAKKNLRVLSTFRIVLFGVEIERRKRAVIVGGYDLNVPSRMIS